MKIVVLAAFLLLISCAGTSPRFTAEDPHQSRRNHEPRRDRDESDGKSIGKGDLRGQASWYGDQFHGRKTASGEKFDMSAFTAAHRTIPFNSIVEVVNEKTGKSVRVRINDRGPSDRKRVIDLSKGAASKLGIIEVGVAEVTLRVIKNP